MVEVAARPDVDPHYRSFYDRIAHRRGRKIAQMALARQVATLCYYALRDEGRCRPFLQFRLNVSVRRGSRRRTTSAWLLL